MVMGGGVMGGAGPILFWCAALRRPQASSARRSGALVWVGSRQLGALGRAVCRSSCIPPPPPRRRGPFWGRGGVPSAPEGRRVAPVALKLWGGSRGVGALRRPPPPRLVRRQLAICCLRRAPLGYTRAVGVAGRPRASAAARSAANRSVRRGGEGGAGTPPPWFAPRPHQAGL